MIIYILRIDVRGNRRRALYTDLSANPSPSARTLRYYLICFHALHTHTHVHTSGVYTHLTVGVCAVSFTRTLPKSKEDERDIMSVFTCARVTKISNCKDIHETRL